ncbi:MAG: alpha/beta hydrolase [Candidatus Saccharimonas sp.]|nr:alpha/beta hydrolase [Planctomycetaceae bacterium]
MSDALHSSSATLGDPRAVATETASTEPDTHDVPSVRMPGSVPSADAPPVGEPCPAPLVWQEVLAAYRSESTAWELTNGSHRLVGRTWGQGRPLYLLNGFTATAEMTALTMWLLREEFHCVVFDTLADGASRGTRPTMSDFASDVLAAADHHGDSTLNVFGASFGAAVALQTALESPSRIAGLVLQHGFARRRLSMSERMLAAWCRRSHRALSQFPWRRRIQELNHRRWFPPFDGTRFEFLVDSTGSIPLADLARKALVVNGFDVSSRLGEITCPVLLLRTEGEGGLEARSHAQLELGLRGSRTEWMHSSGLHPALTHPHRLVKLLKSFFSPEPA